MDDDASLDPLLISNAEAIKRSREGGRTVIEGQDKRTHGDEFNCTNPWGPENIIFHRSSCI